jgi:hypothetical protein
MFKSDCTEAKSGILIIEDMGSTAVQKLLNFIYSGSIDLSDCEAEVIAELLNAAEKVGNLIQMRSSSSYEINKYPKCYMF